jgi:hypothetical protein
VERGIVKVKITKEKKTLTQQEWIGLILGVAGIFGVLVRFLPGLIAGFPLNDGGMFLSMIRDLNTSQYALPKFTSYNDLNIPFAYPPFGFYFARLLSDLLAVPELTLLRWLPPLVNSFSILAFYLLASELMKSKSLGALASAFYALTPGAFGWFVMGGGLTRSFGSLFLLLTVYSALRLFQSGEKKFTALSILFGGLTVLSHPEAGIHAAVTCLLMWIIFGRTVQSFLNSILVGVGVLLLTAPWWGTVLSYHGLTPFLSAVHTGSYGTPLWKALLSLLVGEGVIPILALLRLIGLGWGVWKKQYFLLAWVLIPYLMEPRSAPSVAFYPMTMLITLGFAEAIPYFIKRIRKSPLVLDELYKNTAYNVVLFLTLILLFVDSSLFGFRLVGNSLKLADLDAMSWIEANTSENALFLPLTGNPSPEIDPFIEWFPALAERHSQTTIQGLEWTLAEKFFLRYTDLANVQACVSIDCVIEWSERTGLDYQYVVVRKAGVSEGLLESFKGSTEFQQVYSNNGVSVFELIKK